MVIPVKKEKPMPKVFIIAEAGVNHNGSLWIAKKMVDAAVNAGADAIKFQTFDAESLATKNAPKAVYQKKFTGKKESQLEMLKKLQLDLNAHRELIRHCQAKKIIFLSSPFDLESIDLLAGLGLRIFKIPSGEITNLPYLRKIGSLRGKILMSTGMANLKEIKDALRVLIKSGTSKKNITVLHCNTEYPTPFKDVNLSALTFIKDKLGVQVGYSDHTLGLEVAIASVALSASVVEKHFTLSRKMKGPDQKASLEPQELRAMVWAIRNVETALGNGIKKLSDSETKNISIVRKSIVALREIKKQEIFSETNLTVKRPGTGLSPMLWDKILGKKAKCDFLKDEKISI
ncbi:MAG: N-acetylneuraminate synthase [Phycisphaerae bacterium]|jgi:N,N'-diacetyllegionaminate synthase